MMKKVLKIGFLASLLIASTSAFAQQKPEFPVYSFGSNWSVGGSFDLLYQHPMGPVFGDGAGLGKTTNLGIDVFAEKRLSNMFDVRFRLGLPAWIPAQGLVATDEGNRVMSNHGSLTVDFKWSINRTITGYDPESKWSIYLYLGAGMGLCFNKVYNNNLIQWGTAGSVHSNFQYGFFGVAMTGGIGYTFAISENDNLFVEYGRDWDMDLPVLWGKQHHTNSILRFGYYYNFGVTDADKAIIAQKALLTQENFDALNAQVNDLKGQVAASRNNEKKLENRIGQLEDQLANSVKNTGNNAAADSLQAVIDKIKADQLTFYAMPFSVQYDVDQWNVSEEEMAKVKAVARVMKDNSDVKVMVVGFADYTGSDQYNMKLSEKRANEVKRLLVKKYGIDEDRIQTDYKGKSVAFGDIKYALNRRVSFYRVIE